MFENANLVELRERYQQAKPYPHITIDNFLPADLAMQLAHEFPGLEQMSKLFNEPMSYKAQTSDVAHKAPAFAGIFAELQSPAFRAALEQITGICNLLADDMLAGGGLHQSPNSGFLDLHVDANFHPFDKSMHRRLNLLIYLSPDWNEAWGGQLQLWTDKNKKPDRLGKAVTPAFNRAVIFSTTRTSWHGVAPITCPPGQSRKSLALYYYTSERAADEVYTDSSVIWYSKTILWKRLTYPALNFTIARLKPYAKYLRRKGAFDAAPSIRK